MTILQKSTAEKAGDDPFVFVMSDASIDRMGDVIEQDGWNLTNFKGNPIALFGHDSGAPIGNWVDVKVVGGKLIGKLQFLAKGLSARIDELRALVEAGMLRAVSVGFRPLDYEALAGSKVGGVRYKAQELLECSLVSVPANANALAVAKTLKISNDVRLLVFGETADRASDVLRRGMPGENAAKPHRSRTKSMATLTERVTDAQTEVVRIKDQLTEHTKQDDFDTVVSDELSNQLEASEEKLASLQRAEKALATKAVERQAPANEPRRVGAVAAKKTEPRDLIIRAGLVTALAKMEQKPLLDVLRERYGEDDSLKAMLDVTTRSASAPAMTTTTGWASALVQTATLDFIDALLPLSVYPTLRDRGGKFSFDRAGVVSIPGRSSTPSVAGSFVAQGGAIPVRQAGFTAITITPRKMAVITVFTREMAEHSTPAIEDELRKAIQEDTAVSIDTVLLDATAASDVRPAGLRSGVTGITPATGGGFNALVADIKGLVGAVLTTSMGNLRSPVFIMNGAQALSIAMTQNAGGDFPFAAGIANSTLQGYPVIQSATVPVGTIVLIDAADFFTATGDEPRFLLSDQATLHMEDTSPQPISSAGTPNAVSAPVRSLMQTDSLALRMTLDINWAMRRTGTVSFVQNVTW